MIRKLKCYVKMLRNAVGDGRCQISLKKTLRRCTVQHYWRYEGMGGCRISRVLNLRAIYLKGLVCRRGGTWLVAGRCSRLTELAVVKKLPGTVEPLTNDHPHQRPSLSYDHISCDGQSFLFVYESLTSDHPSYTTTPM